MIRIKGFRRTFCKYSFVKGKTVPAILGMGRKKHFRICVPSKDGLQSSAPLLSHPLWAKNKFVFRLVSQDRYSYLEQQNMSLVGITV